METKRPIYQIDDVDDPRIAVYRQLKQFSADTRGNFCVEGRLLVERLVASRQRIHSIFCEPDHVDRIVADWKRLRPTEIATIYVAPSSIFREIVGFPFHRGMLACGVRPEETLWPELLDRCEDRGVVVVLPATLDPRNVGAIVRNCAAFGVHALLLGHRSADPYSRQAIRVSMGTALDLPIHRASNLVGALDQLQQRGFELVATVLDPEAESLPLADRSDRLALIFGTEGDGDDYTWLEQCDRRVTLPMQGRTDSLNVANAAAVFLYHFCVVRE